MFDFFTNAADNAIDVVSDLMEGKAPSKRQMAKLVDAGLTVYAISEVTGITSDVLEKILDQESTE